MLAVLHLLAHRLKKDQVLECFTKAAKTVLKKTCYANALGR